VVKRSLSHAIVFLYFFALIIEEGFLISPCYSLELCIQMGISFPFLLCLSRLFFSQLFVRPPRTTILPFSISFSFCIFFLVHLKGDQSWVFIGRTDAEAETPILWPPDAKNWLIGKDSDAGKDWRQEEKGTTEDEMIGWHHWLNGHEFEQAYHWSWLWTGKPCVLQSMGSQRVEHDWVTELNWNECPFFSPWTT